MKQFKIINMSKITITIDGGSGVGKGTISKALAEQLNYQLIDSGAMYRTIAYLLHLNNIEPENVKTQDLNSIQFFYKNNELRVKTNDESFAVEELPIRTQENSQNSSKYAVIPIIREHITKQIREIMSKGGYVLEGRDAGSVIFPQAEIKFFVECPIEIRAKRRLEDYKQKGILYTKEEVVQELEERDHRDMNRETDPLIIPKNAYMITNDDSKSLDQRIEEMVQIVNNYN